MISLGADSVIKIHDLRTNRCLQTIAAHDWLAAADAKPAALLYDARRRRDALHLPRLSKPCTACLRFAAKACSWLGSMQRLRVSAQHAARCSQSNAGPYDNYSLIAQFACHGPIGG